MPTKCPWRDWIGLDWIGSDDAIGASQGVECPALVLQRVGISQLHVYVDAGVYLPVVWFSTFGLKPRLAVILFSATISLIPQHNTTQHTRHQTSTTGRFYWSRPASCATGRVYTMQRAPHHVWRLLRAVIFRSSWLVMSSVPHRSDAVMQSINRVRCAPFWVGFVVCMLAVSDGFAVEGRLGRRRERERREGEDQVGRVHTANVVHEVEGRGDRRGKVRSVRRNGAGRTSVVSCGRFAVLF